MPSSCFLQVQSIRGDQHRLRRCSRGIPPCEGSSHANIGSYRSAAAEFKQDSLRVERWKHLERKGSPKNARRLASRVDRRRLLHRRQRTLARARRHVRRLETPSRAAVDEQRVGFADLHPVSSSTSTHVDGVDRQSNFKHSSRQFSPFVVASVATKNTTAEYLAIFRRFWCRTFRLSLSYVFVSRAVHCVRQTQPKGYTKLNSTPEGPAGGRGKVYSGLAPAEPVISSRTPKSKMRRDVGEDSPVELRGVRCGGMSVRREAGPPVPVTLCCSPALQ